MTIPTLAQLYADTGDLVASQPNNFVASLDWLDRILPRFLDACRLEVANGSQEVVILWRNWLSGPSAEFIRDAGGAEAFEWRKTWMTVFIHATELLLIDEARRDRDNRNEIALQLMSASRILSGAFPQAFWLDLVDLLSGMRDAEIRSASAVASASITIAFPLVLSESLVVNGDSLNVILSDFVCTPTSYGEGEAYLDPEQVLMRCLTRDFSDVFSQSSKIIRQLYDGLDAMSVRISIRSRIPSNDIFLQKLTLGGSSGGGALGVGLYSLWKGNKSPIPPDSAVSFSLIDSSKNVVDGRCHAVGSAYEKIRGAARAGITRLLVAAEQESQVAFYGHLQNVAIVGAATVQEALTVVDVARTSLTSSVTIAHSDDGGVMSLDSPLYLERRSDAHFFEALARRPMIILVKGARQIGKTSLLVRGVDRMRRQHVQLVYVDLQSIGRDSLLNQRDLFVNLSRIFARELKLSVTLDDIYDERDGPNKNFENFMFRYALRFPVIWFMDEVDRLFEFDYYTDVFSLMRSWHNRRPIHPELGNLSLVLSYATETHLLIEDAYQSPFNVGVKVEMEDFSRDQVAELNFKLGSPLASHDELDEFVKLAGGHPHLVCRGLSWMVHERKNIHEFRSRASLDNGPFGTHLRRLRMLTQNPEHLSAVRDILLGRESRNNDAFLHLRSAGVVTGDEVSNAKIRCEIYSAYIRRHIVPAQSKDREPRGLWKLLKGRLN